MDNDSAPKLVAARTDDNYVYLACSNHVLVYQIDKNAPSSAPPSPSTISIQQWTGDETPIAIKVDDHNLKLYVVSTNGITLLICKIIKSKQPLRSLNA